MSDEHIIGSGLTDQELKVANFWVRNRILLRKIGYGVLAGIGALSWLFVLWHLLDAYAISYPREARIASRIIQNQVALDGLAAAAPKPITPSQTSVFQTTENRLDYLVEIMNPNATWWAEFDYQFETAGQRTPRRQGYILPSGKRYLTELGHPATGSNRTGRLVVDNIRWHRVNPSDVQNDYASYVANRLQFRIEDATYTRDLTIGTQTVGQSRFTVVNESAYGYWNPTITLVLFRGTTPVAVTTLQRTHIRPGESAPFIVNWFENIAGVSKSDIRVDINILDPEAYLPTSGV